MRRNKDLDTLLDEYRATKDSVEIKLMLKAIERKLDIILDEIENNHKKR